MNRFFYECLAAYLAAAASAVGELSSFELTVAAGRHERNNVPVRVPMPRDKIGTERIASVTLAGPDGKSIPAQWTGPGLASTAAGEVHFVLPHLAAGESVRLKATLSTQSPSSAGGFAWHDHPGHHTDLSFGERSIITYHYEPLDESTPASRVRTYKVFHQVYSPKGDRIVTNGLNEDPKVHSPHHRGIFYGFNRISYGGGQTADTWHCKDGAFQQHERFLASEEGPVLGRHRAVISWHGKEAAFAEEERELTVFNVPGGHLIEFASRLRTPSGPVRFDGDPQHAGFQFRAHNDVDAFTTQETIYVRPDGTGKPGETRNWDPETRQGPVNLPWNAMSFVLGGTRFTTAYLDHPGNPKEARFSERGFGRFGSYFEYTIEKEKPLTVNYRLWLQEGLMKPEQVAALSNNFVEPVKVTVQEPDSTGVKEVSEFKIAENDERIAISSSMIEAVVRKKGYVTGVAAGSFLDKQSGFRDAGYGLDIVDWIMEPGSDEAYRDQLPGDLAYLFNNSYHGKTAKRSIEGPQICTKAGELSPRVIQGKDFVAVTSRFQYQIAAPGKKAGSEWSQVLVFPDSQRYFISSDRITSVNSSDAMFLRLDMPGHIKHTKGDTFSEIYLSYAGKIPSSEFFKDFAPDEKFNYRREANPVPKRFIRAYHLRDPKTGRDGPWLAGMTLDPSVVYEAWCHQRGYVCLIEEFGGRPIKPGDSFSAAFIVGFFDSIEEMEKVYDRYAGAARLEADPQGWKLHRN